MSLEQYLLLAAALAALIVTALILRFVSISRPALALSQAPQWNGIINGQPFTVDIFSTDAWTVSLSYPPENKTRFIASMRLIQPKLANNRVAQHLSALEKLGADLIDFGVHAEWIAAEVPFLRASISHDNARNIATELIKLKKTIGSEKTSVDAPRPMDLNQVLSLFRRVFRHHLNQD